MTDTYTDPSFCHTRSGAARKARLQCRALDAEGPGHAEQRQPTGLSPSRTPSERHKIPDAQPQALPL
jgi:hypothetical protein